jgi:hypothetical protein
MDEFEQYLKKQNITQYLSKNEINNYTINNDLTVNVQGNVILKYVENGQIPIQFGYVSDSFEAIDLGLTTLKGSPYKVGKTFFVKGNNLTNLEYSPKFCNSFVATDNQLTSVKGISQEINGDCDLARNKLISLKGLESVFFRASLDIRNNPLTQIDTILKVGDALFLDHALLHNLTEWKHEIKEEIVVFAKNNDFDTIFKDNALSYERCSDELYKLKLSNEKIIMIMEKRGLEKLILENNQSNKKLKI